MIGQYKTIDDCIYEVFMHKPPGKNVKPEIMCKCIKSTVRNEEMKAFSPIPGQIERNIRHKLWTKIES